MLVRVEPDGEVDHRHAPVPSTLQLLDIEALAKMLGVTYRHVQRLVSERRIPFLKVGRFIRFDPAEILVWLDERRIEMHVPPYRPGSHGR
jgi:excisionase family DNA binding protein